MKTLIILLALLAMVEQGLMTAGVIEGNEVELWVRKLFSRF